MKTRMRSQTTLVLVLALLSLGASAATLVVEGNYEGRHYQVYAANGISWLSADSNANGTFYNDIRGHLATITSEGEDAFIDELRNQATNIIHPVPLSRPEVWVGGKQLDGSTEPGAGWIWINNEGPISTSTAALPSYSNWLDGEPNDQNTEKYLGVGLNGDFGWNDEQALGNIGGYVVEFDNAIPVDPEACTSPTGCETTMGQIIQYPAGALGQDPKIGIKTYEFTDDLVNRCGQVPLVLFANDGIDNNEVTVPPYLCGSPKFLLVHVETSGVDIFNGTVLVENEVEEVFPDNLYDCPGPFDDSQPLSADYLDPQHRDKVTYQTSNPAEMLESTIGAAVNAKYAGSLSEVTFECGSSRGKTKSSSYYGVGLSFNYGPGNSLLSNPTGNLVETAALTKYKLLVLQASVVESKPALHRLTYKVLKALVDTAIKLHDRKKYQAALLSVRLFLYVSNAANYAVIPYENYNGEHQMRGSNIDFMYTSSILPLLN